MVLSFPFLQASRMIGHSSEVGEDHYDQQDVIVAPALEEIAAA